jgi:hypothetical protein
MSFYKEIEDLVDYIYSIRKLKTYFSFDIEFPPNWTILKTHIDESKTVVNKTDKESKSVSFVSEITDEGVSETILRIRKIVEYNKEKEEKQRLFNEKVSELKGLFEKQDLKELKHLKIDIEDVPTLEGEESISG